MRAAQRLPCERIEGLATGLPLNSLQWDKLSTGNGHAVSAWNERGKIKRAFPTYENMDGGTSRLPDFVRSFESNLCIDLALLGATSILLV